VLRTLLGKLRLRTRRFAPRLGEVWHQRCHCLTKCACGAFKRLAGRNAPARIKRQAKSAEQREALRGAARGLAPGAEKASLFPFVLALSPFKVLRTFAGGRSAACGAKHLERARPAPPLACAAVRARKAGLFRTAACGGQRLRRYGRLRRRWRAERRAWCGSSKPLASPRPPSADLWTQSVAVRRSSETR
jgi:hypothetical protein